MTVHPDADCYWSNCGHKCDFGYYSHESEMCAPGYLGPPKYREHCCPKWSLRASGTSINSRCRQLPRCFSPQLPPQRQFFVFNWTNRRYLIARPFFTFPISSLLPWIPALAPPPPPPNGFPDIILHPPLPHTHTQTRKRPLPQISGHKLPKFCISFFFGPKPPFAVYSFSTMVKPQHHHRQPFTDGWRALLCRRRVLAAAKPQTAMFMARREAVTGSSLSRFLCGCSRCLMTHLNVCSHALISLSEDSERK